MVRLLSFWLPAVFSFLSGLRMVVGGVLAAMVGNVLAASAVCVPAVAVVASAWTVLRRLIRG